MYDIYVYVYVYMYRQIYVFRLRSLDYKQGYFPVGVFSVVTPYSDMVGYV